MKKLTAGIFASLLAVVATGAAHAEIASKGYVDDINTALTSAIGAKADTTTVTALDGRVDTAEGEIDTIQGTMETYGDVVTHDASEFATAAQGTKADTAVQPAAISDMQVKANLTTNAEWATEKAADDKYPSNAAVDAAIKSATSELPTSSTITEIQGDITEIKDDVAGLQTSKQDADTAVEVGAAGTAVGSTTQPVYVNESGVVTPTNALGSLAWESTVGTAEIEDDAVTTAKIGDGQVTAAKIASGVVPTVTTSIVTGNTGAAQAGAVADALAGKVDDADLGAYSTTAQMNTAISSATENMQTTTNLVTTIRDSATATDAQYPSEKAVATAIDTITTDAIEGLNLGALATMNTVGSAQIDNGAVTQAKIGANAVGSTQIADGAVTTGKIADGTITNADISNNAEIAMAKIAGLEEALAGVIEKPEGCQGVGSDCVLVIKDGAIQWEDVARGGAE